jgi:hydrogenase maturation protease
MWSDLLMQILPFIQNDPLLQTNQAQPVLVLGLGNILLQDEGVGVRVVQQLRHDYICQAEVEIMDGGTAGMALYEHIIGRSHLVVIDAVRSGNPPGTILMLENEEVPVFLNNRISPHQLALSDILAVLQIAGERLPEVILLGIEPARLETGVGLSATVSSQLDTLLQITTETLQEIGYPLQRKVIH